MEIINEYPDKNNIEGFWSIISTKKKQQPNLSLYIYFITIPITYNYQNITSPSNNPLCTEKSPSNLFSLLLDANIILYLFVKNFI